MQCDCTAQAVMSITCDLIVLYADGQCNRGSEQCKTCWELSFPVLSEAEFWLWGTTPRAAKGK